jgi:hypothetical protein
MTETEQEQFDHKLSSYWILYSCNQVAFKIGYALSCFEQSSRFSAFNWILVNLTFQPIVIVAGLGIC